MSFELPYVTRLYFELGHIGCARLPGGFVRPLNVAPAIQGMPPIEMIDWVPTVVAIVRLVGYGMRDLEPHEQRSAHEWLLSLRGPC
jgi:hypothetical protein